MSALSRVRHLLSENQMSVVFFALVFGLLAPRYFSWLNTYTTQLLILVFFFSSLRLSLDEILTYAKDWRMLLIANAYMLLVLPFALYYPFLLISKEWALALLILGAAPTGMTIALVAEFFRGKTSLALLITTTTSLLAPLTIPFVFQVAIGQAIPIPVVRMFWSLFLTIVLPFVLAMLVKRAAPKHVAKFDPWWRNLSVAAFALLIAGIVSDTAGNTLAAFSWTDLSVVALALAWIGLIVWSSYYLIPWRNASERITIALCLIYLNNTLALFIGDKFFRDFGVIPKLLLLLLAMNALLPPLRLFAGRLTKQKRTRNVNPIT